MKIAAIIFGVLAFIAVLGFLWITASYNSLVVAEETVNEKWAQVENQYQRRIDLIPNLVATVEGFADQEKEVLLGVTEARSKWAEASSANEKIEAAAGVERALARLLLVTENYPNLKSDQNFLALQASLEGTENRISVERMRYNEVVRDYNTKVRVFPTNILAGMMGFEKQEFFEAIEGAETAPKVDFS